MAAPLLGVESSFNSYQWVQKPYTDKEAEYLTRRFDLPFIVAQILSSRNIKAEEAEAFLYPSMKKHLPDPSRLKDMDKGVARAAKAIKNGEKIAIFGDYDVDGATSSSLLYLFLKTVGAEVILHIPDRDDGYGPNMKAMEDFISAGVHLLLTVDCGTGAAEPLNFISSKGVDTIVIDHHEPDITAAPTVHALINPKRIDEAIDNPWRSLAAVGVAFMFIIALNRLLRTEEWYSQNGIPEPDIRQWLDLVALGTVCDVVPLIGLNRLLVKSGLKYFAKRSNIGLAALSDSAGIKEAPGTYHLGFVLGPRINAGGRIGNAALGASLICTPNDDEAASICKKLEELNATRKEIEAAVSIEAIEQIESRSEEQNIAFAYGKDWHAGVIGIVAGRLKERYNLPSFVISIDGDEAHGSCRSVPGIDIGSAVLDALAHGIISKGGGHIMAAGFSLPAANIPEAYRFFSEHIASQAGKDLSTPELELDGVLDINAVNLELAETLNLLEPFGEGNPEPKFALKEVGVYASGIRGSGHIVCTLSGRAGGSVKAIAFKAADTGMGKSFLENHGEMYNLAGYLKINEWNGRKSVQFVIIDAHKI
ncbi:MAG: single-stranded-DNA-specific exonuclease RecJ [Alphaproteobacteria bacterium]|nr:single-stranded-DNA-specific exonuclease RecJ [Alphaproteobacteria bacterium]